jgi:hypothetical protein
MARKSFEALNKAKRQEASARAAKRRAVASMNDEYASAVRKHFPELEASKTVDDEIVPVVDDVDKFFEEVARVYHAYKSKGESSTTQEPKAGNPEPHYESSPDFPSTGFSQGVSTDER